MNEITRVHLGRQPFTVAVDAHKALQEYLHAIKKAVGKSHKEVVEEVELRMAELLTERGITGDKVVMAEDVAYLKEQLGKPGDFAEDGEDDHKAPEQPEEGERVQKRLFRDTDHAAIAGVLSGIAAYTGLNLILLRILTVILTFVSGGTVILIYLILWLAIPAARTQSEKLQMRGKPVTVDSLKELVDQADFEGAANRAGRAIEPAAVTIGKVLLAIIGVFLVIKGVLTWIGAVAAGSFMFVSGIQVDGVQLFPVGVKEVMLVICGLAILLIWGAVTTILGLAAVRHKWPVKGWLMGVLAGLFVLFASLGTALAINVAPAIEERTDSVRHDKVLTQTEFKQLHVQGDSSFITYEQSDRYAVEVHYIGSKNRDFSQLATVKDGVLTLDMAKIDEAKRCGLWCIDAENVQVKVFAPSLQELRVDGDTYVGIDQPINQEQMTITVSGESHVNLHGVEIAKVTIQDQRERGYQQLTASGIRNNHEPFPVEAAISMSIEEIRLNDVTEVDVTTAANACEERESFVQVAGLPQVLRINGEQIESADQLESAQRMNEERSMYHCVELDRRTRN